MTVKVRIPTALRAYTDQLPAVQVAPGTVGEALRALTERYGALRGHLYDEHGSLRGFVNLYVNQTDIRALQREETPLRAGDTLLIVPSVAGG